MLYGDLQSLKLFGRRKGNCIRSRHCHVPVEKAAIRRLLCPSPAILGAMVTQR